jgi:peptidoglycan/LPS O-acetylase OafA/YrhL
LTAAAPISEADTELHSGYRADIDGLRAFAVLSVVWYHAFPNYGRGGFVGVDVFFVISGFLISTIVFEGVLDGRFSYLDFYRRRIRRIFPALILILLACLLFASTFAFPKDARLIGEHVIGGVGFASNFVLWNESGYFDWGAELKPLLHLWSLSVEEQYYIFWPVLAAFLLKRGRWFITVTLLLFVGSFVANIVLVRVDPTAAFYLPVTRMWELLVGSGLAYVTLRRGSLPAFLAPLPADHAFDVNVVARRRGLEQILSIAGGALLLAAVLAITRESAFPGWWALLPTFGAFLVIAAGPRGWVNRVVFSNRGAVFVGKISYPLYLWHWPLLVFPNIVAGHLSRPTRMAAVALAILLAWLTYEYVEKPIRFGRKIPRVPTALASVMVVLAFAGGLLIASDGWVRRLPPELRTIATAEFKFESDGPGQPDHHCFLLPEEGVAAFGANCIPPSPAGTPRVWIWGDSHSDSLYPGILALSEGGRRFTLTQRSASACPPVIGFEMAKRPHCKEINDDNLRRIVASPPDVVLLASNWTLYDGGGWEKLEPEALAHTASLLRAAGVRRVVIIGQLPRWQISQPTALLTQWRETGVLPTRNDRYLHPSSWPADRLVGRAAAEAGVNFVSPMSHLCDPKAGCLLTIDAGGKIYPVAWDEAHVTGQAALMLGRQWQSELLGDIAPAAASASAIPTPTN